MIYLNFVEDKKQMFSFKVLELVSDSFYGLSNAVNDQFIGKSLLINFQSIN